jgi:lipoprotein LprG
MIKTEWKLEIASTKITMYSLDTVRTNLRPSHKHDRHKGHMRRNALIFLLILTAASCSSPTPTPIPPEELITGAAERMTKTSGFRFSVDRSGAPAFLDPLEILSLSRLEGDFIAPDRVQAAVRIVTTGIVSDISFIGIGVSQWQTNPFTGNWESVPTGSGFNPASLFDPEIGLQAILLTDLEELELLENAEIDTLPGQPLFHLSGRMLGERTFEITYGLIGPEAMDAELWITTDTRELQRIILTERIEDPKNTRIWQFDFWDYDLDLDISSPQQ